MRIGIEAQRIFRPKKHGMDIVALESIRSLQRIDSKNEYVVFVKPDEDTDAIQSSSNVEVVVGGSGPYPYWEQVYLPSAAKKHGVELLHCTSNTAPLKCSMPLVLTLHDIIYLEKLHFDKGTWYQRLGNLYRRWNVPAIIPKANVILTVSDFERKRITEFLHLAENRIQTLYNGVGSHFKPGHSEKVQHQIRDKYRLPEEYFFFLGNTDPKKNVIGVLKALQLFYKSEPSSKLKMVMPDYDRSHLNKLIQEVGDPSLADRIHLCGYIPNSELPPIYGMAKFSLYPSLRESFGIPILEAMGSGTAVITSNTSSMPEVAGGAALLVDPLKPETISAAMSRLLHDQHLRTELIEKGLSRAASFTWDRTAAQLISIYESVLKSNA
jgi:glycosyltransferase involved in cell wall biosynthesis